MAKEKLVKPAEEIPEIDLVMESVEVKSKSRKLKTEREEEVEIQKPELTFEQLKNMSHQNIKKYYEE